MSHKQTAGPTNASHTAKPTEASDTPSSTERVCQASLDWSPKGNPASSEFDDVYFFHDTGLEESRYVFLEHNRLAERWSQLATDNHATGDNSFVIAETGFGTGLNFLSAWQLWRQTAPSDARLHFISVEKFPLSRQHLAEALALWPELEDLTQALLDNYPSCTSPGFHRLHFDDRRVSLTLIFDDAQLGLEQCLSSQHPLFQQPQRPVDAWFLDGFTPVRNPQMWTDELFRLIDQLSGPDCSAATFTAAGIVRRGLLGAGFQVHKAKGFGRKREMLYAQRSAEHTANRAAEQDFDTGAFNCPYPVPWAVARKQPTEANSSKQVTIIGGGLAGCHSARALAEQGWQVTLIERHGQLAQEASGNPQGALYAKLSPNQEAQAAFNLSCLLYAQRFYAPHWQAPGPKTLGHKSGLLQLAHTPKRLKLQQQLDHYFGAAEDFVQAVDASQASALAGIEIPHPGLYFPDCGWLDPAALCRQLVDHPSIRLQLGYEVTALEHIDKHWHLQLTAKNSADSTQLTNLSASHVVIACAYHAQQFEQTRQLPLKSIRGQVSYLPTSEQSRRLQTVICADGYFTPAHNDSHCAGATFNLNDDLQELRASDHQNNVDNLHKACPALTESLSTEGLTQGRVGFRCTTPDYLPLVGPAPKFERFIEDYALLRKNAKSGIPLAGDYWPNLYLNIGYGSRGLAYTPLCAEQLACLLNQQPPPLPQSLSQALNPARFIIRDLIRNKC